MRVVNVEGVDIGVDPAARRITIPGGDDGHHHPAHPVNAVAFLAAGMWLRHLQRVVRREERAELGEEDARGEDADGLRDLARAVAVANANANANARAPHDAEDDARDDPADAEGVATTATRDALESHPLADPTDDPSRGASTTTTSTTTATTTSTITTTTPDATAPVAGGGRVCRFCFVGDDDDDDDGGGGGGDGDVLVSPCRCTGTQEWVHVGCLRQWQRVSMRSSGAREKRCRVCHATFKLPRPPMREALAQWFSSRATDRLSQYKRVWWQMLSNSVLAQEGTPHLSSANQLLRLVIASELRIWGGREVRGGNRALRTLRRVARDCTNFHSIVLVAWLLSLGALSAGDALNHPGGPLDVIDQELRARQGAGAGRGGRGERGFGWRGKLFGAAKLVVGKPLGFALRLVVPSAGAFMRLAEPVHGVITWVERYPQYRVV